MAVRVSRDWLLDHGYPADLLDAILAATRTDPPTRRTTRSVPVLPGEPRLEACHEYRPGCWQATIADWRPASDNLRARGTWVWAKAKRRDVEILARLLVSEAGIPAATGRRRVTLEVTKRSKRGVRDPANMLKSLHDALVNCGLIRDDDEEWLDWERPRIAVDKKQDVNVLSTLWIEDLT